MVKSTPEELAARSEVRGRATWHLATFPKPIIGAINGLAYGAWPCLRCWISESAASTPSFSS